jgi:PAS domain-containing protein
MIGQDLRIRRITPGAQKALNLIAADVGRPLANIKTNLRLANLETLISGVIESTTPVSREVQDTYGHWYAMKIRPYRTVDNTIHGAVLVLVDIEAAKLSEESAGAWRSFVEPLPDFILSAEPEGKILFVNRTSASLAQEADVGDNIYDHLDPRNHEALRHGIQRVLRTGESAAFQIGAAAGSSWANKIVPIKNKSDGTILALTLITIGREKVRAHKSAE